MPSLADALAKKGIANADGSAPTAWLTTGNPVLDHRISGKYHGGGLPQGRMNEIFGPPSAGKTVIATELMIATQKAGGVAVFFDHERSFDSNLAKKNGLDLNPSKFIYLKPETFEAAMDTITEIGDEIRQGKHIDPTAPITPVFDSLAGMIPLSKWDKNATNYNMNDNTALARATSAAFPTIAQRCELWNMTAIFLNQIRTKPGVTYGDPTTTPGGGAMEFYASVRLKLGGSKVSKEGVGVIGKKITCETWKNKTYRPFQKTEWDFIFQKDGSGSLDVIGAVIDELKAIGKLEAAGAYLMWEGKKLYKSQITTLAEDDPAVKAKLFSLLP